MDPNRCLRVHLLKALTVRLPHEQQFLCHIDIATVQLLFPICTSSSYHSFYLAIKTNHILRRPNAIVWSFGYATNPCSQNFRPISYIINLNLANFD